MFEYVKSILYTRNSTLFRQNFSYIHYIIEHMFSSMFLLNPDSQKSYELSVNSNR